jgi:hypothetical protein
MFSFHSAIFNSKMIILFTPFDVSSDVHQYLGYASFLKLLWPSNFCIVRVYLAFGNTDMRKSINGLSIIVEQHSGK